MCLPCPLLPVELRPRGVVSGGSCFGALSTPQWCVVYFPGAKRVVDLYAGELEEHHVRGAVRRNTSDVIELSW